jgi:hypothetical protein
MGFSPGRRCGRTSNGGFGKSGRWRRDARRKDGGADRSILRIGGGRRVPRNVLIVAYREPLRKLNAKRMA